MEKIDLKDRKILYQLDLNCRQSNAQIGKRVGLSKQVVDYRVKRMEEDGIIKNYWTEFNTFKLGYNCYRIYINFQDVSANIKNEIIKYFSNLPNAWAVMTVKGPIDFDVMLWVKDSHKFNIFWNKTLDKFGMYFTESTISILSGGTAFKKTYLLYEEYKEIDRKFFILSSGGLTADIDWIDYEIMNDLAINARISLIELAEKLDISSQSVSYRIKNLIKKGVILALRTNINNEKLGLQNTCLDIILKDHSKKNKILNYVSYIPYVEYIIETVGWADIQLELFIRDFYHLTQIIEELNLKFSDAIRKQDFWMSKEYHRLRMLPEIEFKKIK